MLPDCLLALLTTPVDDDNGTIRCLGKVTGGIGREPEDGWSAHAPMGEQQWTVGTELGATLEDMHLSMRVEPLYVNGAEAACGASTDEGDRH